MIAEIELLLPSIADELKRESISVAVDAAENDLKTLVSYRDRIKQLAKEGEE